MSRQSMTRGLQRTGVNPSSGKMLAINSQLGLSEAAAKAGAANKVREAARLEGYGLNDRASNLLSGYPAMGMSTTGAGAGFGANGLTLANQGLAGMNSGWGAAATGAGQMGSNATGMYGAQANYKNQQDQIASQNDPFNTILGAAAGVGTSWAMGKVSDRRLKTDIEVVGELTSGLTVYKYRYKSGGPMQIGVMADEVAEMVPQAYIPGGAGNGFDAVDYSKL